jgi:hypothetical protein
LISSGLRRETTIAGPLVESETSVITALTRMPWS